MSRQSSVCCDKHPSKWLRKICHDNNSSIATQRTEYRRGAMSQQKTTCRNRTWEECNKSAEKKKDNVATRFVSWKSTSGRTCRDIKAPIATLKTGREHKFYRNKRLKSNTGRILRHINLYCDIIRNRRQNLCRDKIFSCRDTDYCNLESLLRHCMKKCCRDTERQGFWS